MLSHDDGAEWLPDLPRRRGPKPKKPREFKQKKEPKSRDRGSRFIEKHALKYGLTVSTRNANGDVEAVMCKFCIAFGKEATSASQRKRRMTANIKHFRQPFRPDHYLSHMEINHKIKWAAYELASDAEKEFFFSPDAVAAQQREELEQRDEDGFVHKSEPIHELIIEQPRIAPADAILTRMRSVRLPSSEIERRIVELLVGTMFFDPSDEVGVTKARALDAFVPKAGSPQGNYEIVIRNQRLFDLAIKYIACGASFRLAARLIQCTREETKLTYYTGCSERKIAGYVRALLASNFQKISWMMRTAWAYVIATETALHQGTSYLDVRIRLYQKGSLQDFHLMALPAFDLYPALAILQRLENLLNIMDSNWRAKLLGTTTNGGVHTGRNRAMTGSQQGLAARLTSLVTSPGFYLIWSGLHQLELVVKNCVTDFCEGAFYGELVNILAALRRADTDVFPEGTNIPEITGSYNVTRGFPEVFMQALKWLMERYEVIMQYLQTSQLTSVPSPSWWVCVTVAHRLMSEIEYFADKLGHMEPGESFVSDQVQELCKLALIMTDVVNARRDLWDRRDAEDACSSGSFLLTYQNAQQFIQNEGGPMAIEMFDRLQGIDRLHISKSVASFAVNLIGGVATVAQEGRHYCVESTGVLVNPPLVMPYALFEMGKDAFVKVIVSQKARLLATFSDQEIDTLCREFDSFYHAVLHESKLKRVLKTHGRDTDITSAWTCLNGRFRLLQEFVCTLASVVPEGSAGALATELRTLNWEKPDYRQTMVDFSLEGILHAKQKIKVDLVDINYSHASATSEEEDSASDYVGGPHSMQSILDSSDCLSMGSCLAGVHTADESAIPPLESLSGGVLTGPHDMDPLPSASSGYMVV